jgi:hypothetical protein
MCRKKTKKTTKKKSPHYDGGRVQAYRFTPRKDVRVNCLLPPHRNCHAGSTTPEQAADAYTTEAAPEARYSSDDTVEDYMTPQGSDEEDEEREVPETAQEEDLERRCCSFGKDFKFEF